VNRSNTSAQFVMGSDEAMQVFQLASKRQKRTLKVFIRCYNQVVRLSATKY